MGDFYICKVGTHPRTNHLVVLTAHIATDGEKPDGSFWIALDLVTRDYIIVDAEELIYDNE